MVAATSPLSSLPDWIADALPTLVSYVGQDRRYSFINRAYEEWFACASADIIGRTVEEVLGPVAYAEVGPHVEAALAGQSRRFEVTVPYHGVETRRVEARYEPDRGPDGVVRGYYGLVIDRSNADAQRRIEELVDVFADGFISIDFEWRITYCNRAAATFGRRPREELIGAVYWDLAVGPRDSPLAAMLETVMRTRVPAEMEVASIARPGMIALLRAFPVETGIGVSYGDITQAKLAEAQIKANAERLTALDRRRAFLLDLADSLQSLEDPAAIMGEAISKLAGFLGATRAGYGEVDAGDLVITGLLDWTPRDGVRLARSDRGMEAYGPQVVDRLRRGETLRIDDTAEDARTEGHREAYQSIGVRAIIAAPRMRQGRLDAILYLHDSEPHAWTDDDVAILQDVAARTWSAVDRARSERAVRESEARFRAMADSAPAPVWVTSASGAIEFVNQPFAALAGKTPEELLGDAWLQILHPDDLPRVAAARADARRDSAPYAFEARFRVASGEWRWMQAASRPRFNESGTFQGYVGIAVDVTDSHAADERQRLLINELNHRVKNTLATVQSLAHQTLRDGMISREARDLFTERLLALSAAHNVLTRENWEGAEIGEVVVQAARPYDDGAHARVTIDGPVLRVAPTVALALSMALHELATNAVKYGGLSTPDGHVSVSWTWPADSPAAELLWRETGGPPVRPPSRAGFGSRLLHQGLAAELGSPAVVEYDPAGVICRLRIPIVEG